MNLLAHAYLSFNHSDILVGNMISDFVKGRKRLDYSPGVQKGIVLHRQIDAFTDVHEATKKARSFLKPAVGLYSGAFIDVAYDHFLANDVNEFCEDDLYRFAIQTYEILTANALALPPIFQKMFPYMKSQNWLYNYENLDGIKRSFEGVARRATYLDSSSEVFDLFQRHYSELHECYRAFFPFVKAFAIQQIEQLANQ
jgi:acyl carrier protein phosphodiesterase